MNGAMYNYMYTELYALKRHCAMCETVIACAVSGLDYEAVREEMLEFAVGQTRACHIVTINQDNVCELLPSNEYFFSDLAYESGVSVINIVPQTARVIIADTNEPECGEYSHIPFIISHSSSRCKCEIVTGGWCM